MKTDIIFYECFIIYKMIYFYVLKERIMIHFLHTCWNTLGKGDKNENSRI